MVGRGTGTQLEPAPEDLKGCPVLLVNPRVPLPTGPVFKAWDRVDRGPMPEGSARDIARHGRNDLEAPAIAICRRWPMCWRLWDIRALGCRACRVRGDLFCPVRRCAARDAAAAMIATNHPAWWQLGAAAMIARNHDAYQLFGEPKFGGILIVSDHASNRVPDDIDLGIAPELMEQHIAIDIGVGAIAQIMARRPGIAAFCANVSRLVCDLNRGEHQASTIPHVSDGHLIPGNDLSPEARTARLERFHQPYHNALAQLLDDVPPALILSLHSFTPQLATSDEPRPWHIGVLYNQDDRAPRIAIPLLEAQGLVGGPVALFGPCPELFHEPPCRGRGAALSGRRDPAGFDRRSGGTGGVGRAHG
jgi:predicted N-formylglutamate amidohydrolase